MDKISYKNVIRNIVLYIILLVITGNVSSGQTVPSYVSTDSLQGWYPFNGNANNEFGTGKNGVVLGPLLTTDRFGNPNSAYHFNGNGDHINLDTAFFNVGWSNFSISCWLNSDTLTNVNAYANDQLYFNTEPHNGIDLSYNYNTSNKYTFFANSDPSAATWDILGYYPSHADISIHTWDFVVFTKQNDTVYRFYLNGVLDTTFTSSVVAINYYCKVILGRIDTTHFNQGFLGTLDDYGIWNKTLATCEILRLYNSTAYSYVTLQPVNVTTSPGAKVHFSVTDTGNTHQWQMNSGSGYTNLANTGPYSGVTTDTLTITGVTTVMNSNKFRCVVSGVQTCVDTSGYGELTVNTTSVSNINSTVPISLAPNPTTGDIIVSGAGKTNIRVYNSMGQLVKEGQMTEKISIADLPVGMYIVKLFDATGKIMYIDKVIKY